MKTAVSICIGIAAFCLSIMVMIFGWGLEPQHWGWIIAGGIGAVFLTGVSVAIGEHKKGPIR